MKINIKESTIVRPMKETPNHCLQISELALLSRPAHIPTVYFYRRPNDLSSNFFEADLLKEGLNKVLVPFYPLAGRFRRDESGKLEMHCNAEGVLFIEAETNCALDDLGDFTQNFMWLLPTIDYTKDIYSHPFFVAQVTHFKCGGVSLGTGLHHTIADGTSAFYFLNAWAEMTRGLPIGIQPLFDRTFLNVGVPTFPKFHHIEYDPPPSMNTPSQNMESQSNPSSISTAILKLSVDQINTLKTLLREGFVSNVKHSRFEIVTAHIWRCLCKARGLSDDQASKLHTAINGRSRFNPPIPAEYIDSVIFVAAPIALSGDIQSEPLKYTIKRIHKAIKQMDDEYLKSALAFIKQQSDPAVLRKGGHMYKCPNLNVSNLSRVPIYDTNFGWGRPIFFRPLSIMDGVTHILPSPTDDGSLFVAINLETHHLQLFKKLFYDIFV